MTAPSLPPSARRAGPPRPAARRPSVGARPRPRRLPLLLAAAGTLVVAALAAYYVFVVLPVRSGDLLPVEWPAHAPRGEEVGVAWGARPGEVFVTTVTFRTGVVMETTSPDPMIGMTLDGRFRIAREVLERPPGTRIRSVLYLDRCDGTLPDVAARVWSELGDAVRRPFLAAESDAGAFPRRAPEGKPEALALQRQALDALTSGLGDLAATWVPPRPVRLGETWDLADGVDLSHFVSAMRVAAGTDSAAVVWPAPTWQARAAAEAVEAKDGERCLRVGFAARVQQEGVTGLKGGEGRLVAATRVVGTVWVSLAAGVPWAWSSVGDVVSTHAVGSISHERKGRQFVEATTVRASAMPP